MGEFEYKGIWWLPNEPEKQISGILRFKPNEGATLDLIEDFGNEIVEPEVILGVSSDGKNITLYKCFKTKSSFSIPGFQTSLFYATFVFIGAHFRRPEDIKFKSISVHYSHLDEWVNISGFDIQRDSDKEEILIKYRRPKSIQTKIDDGLKILMVFKPTWSIIVQKEVTIKQKTEIRIETPEDKPFEYYCKVMYHIQNFLSLGIVKPVYPLDIVGTTEANNPPVEIYYRSPEIPKAPVHPHDMLFTFKDISGRFEVFLKNWFEKANILKPVFDLYFGTLYNPRMYLQHQFLSLIQAIEVYHRRKFEGKYLSDEDYKPIYKKFEEVVNGLDVESSFKNSLKRKLEYGNEYSLRRRLKDLFREYQDILNNFIDDRRATFIDKIVHVRNYLTHYSKKEEKVVDRKELYHMIQQLKIIVQICLLSELGFNLEEIRNLLVRCKHVF